MLLEPYVDGRLLHLTGAAGGYKFKHSPRDIILPGLHGILDRIVESTASALQVRLGGKECARR